MHPTVLSTAVADVVVWSPGDVSAFAGFVFVKQKAAYEIWYGLVGSGMCIRDRSGLAQLIGREIAAAEAGQPSGIIIKINAITDPEMVRHLYRASQAGVHVDLLVRGVCVLRPGVPGVSDHIRVRSIIGRFLEHSRIFWFANAGDPKVYIGSADVMERNLDRRVEVLCPVTDPKQADHLRSVVLTAYLGDNRRGRVLTANGSYERDPDALDGDTQSAQDLLLAGYAAESRSDL